MAADATQNPYRGIAARNAFGLRPPPPTYVAPPPAPLAEVKIVGITTMLGDRRALLKIHQPAQPPQPAKEIACILRTGEREGPIEVLAIDEVAGNVSVRNSGTVQLLKLEKDSSRPATGFPFPYPPPHPIHATARR